MQRKPSVGTMRDFTGGEILIQVSYLQFSPFGTKSENFRILTCCLFFFAAEMPSNAKLQKNIQL